LGQKKTEMTTTRTHFTFRVAMLPPLPPKPPPPRPPRPPPPPPSPHSTHADARRRAKSAGRMVPESARPAAGLRLNAAFAQVIAAIADGSWIAQRAAKPSVRSCGFTSAFYGRFGPCRSRHLKIKPHARSLGPHRRPARPGPQRSLSSEPESKRRPRPPEREDCTLMA
jgi:hypothetical protein